MALATTTLWEVRTTGDDTNNGGAFDPGKVSAGGWTDGAATSANTSAPVFTSASYNFVAGDAGAWLFILSGTNWTPGWYKIVSVAANAATLEGTIGLAVLYTAAPAGLSTVVGCATVASPTSAKWTIDYSQQGALQVGYTDLVSAGTGLAVSSAAKPFGRHQVGNALIILSGTNFNAGRYVIATVAAVTFIATVVGPTNITTGAGASGVGSLGGALASPGAAGAIATSGQGVFISGGTYTITSATTNIAAGCYAPGAGAYTEGYQTTRCDLGTPPLLQASGISTFVMVTINSSNSPQAITNIKVDGASLTSSQGFLLVNSYGYKLQGINCTNSAFSSSTTPLTNCLATGCSTQPAFIGANPVLISCVAYSNTITGFLGSTTGYFLRCLAYGNSGASSDGFNIDQSGACVSCTSYNNGRDGFRGTDDATSFVNCIAEGNAAYGYSSTFGAVLLVNCAVFNNTSGATSLSATLNPIRNPGAITGTATFFVDAAGGNFALNTTAGGGALARAAGLGLPLGGTSYLDLGAIQHADPAATGSLMVHPDMSGGMRG